MTAANTTYELDFERPIAQLEQQIRDIETHVEKSGVNITAELRDLRKSHTAMLRKVYGGLSPWQVVQVARHPNRPQPIDYIDAFVKDFSELHGDRNFGDDAAIITGLGRIGRHKCMIVAHNKGKNTRQRIECNWGMAHPEGYRKALLKMKLAEKFGLPVVTLIDTAGAYPGIEAEDRGQAEAIAVNLREMSVLKTPIVSVVVGEGGSGGALGIAVADRVAMMQYAWYSVISPEGCASILWKEANPQTTEQSADSLKLTAADNLKFGVVDEIISEPLGGAHRKPKAATEQLEKWLVKTLRDLKRFKVDNLTNKRFERLRTMGDVAEG